MGVLRQLSLFTNPPLEFIGTPKWVVTTVQKFLGGWLTMRHPDKLCALLLGAGRGHRLQKLTSGSPKWALKIAGQSLGQHIVNTLNQAGIPRTLLARGLVKEQLLGPAVAYIDVPETKNMVETLFVASEHIDEDLIVSYCDILFEPRVLNKLLDCENDIGVVVDAKWIGYYNLRFYDWREDAESCVIDGDKLTEIGQVVQPDEVPDWQYIGLIKFSRKGMSIAREIYTELRKKYIGKPWRNAETFEGAYLTDFLQEMIDRGCNVSAAVCDGGWLEFDTPADYRQALSIQNENMLDVFDFGTLEERPIAVSAGGVVLREENGELSILVGGTGNDGSWRLPKGMLNPTESVSAAAIREVGEETGYRTSIVKYLGEKDWQYEYGGVEWKELCYFYLMTSEKQASLEKDREFESVAWIAERDIEDQLRYLEEQEIAFRACKTYRFQ